MAVLLDYIWQSTFCLLFFYGIYFFFLRNEKAFNLARIYILVTPLLALSFPLINIPVSFEKPDISLEQTQFFRAFSAQETSEEIAATFGLPEVTVQSTKLPFLWEIKDYLILAYFAIIFLLSLRFFWNFIQLRMIVERGWYNARYDLKNKLFFIPTFGLTPFFSFFDKLFWDDTQELLPQEKEHILKHEIEHIRQGHSYDVLYYQVLSIIFWFNPAIHLMKAALVDVHEYLADDRVIRQSSSRESYSRLIVKIAFKDIGLPIGNYFVQSTTLKRILMIKSPNKTNWAKLILILPLSIMLMALISMKTVKVHTDSEKDNKLEMLSSSSEILNLDLDYITLQADGIVQDTDLTDLPNMDAETSAEPGKDFSTFLLKNLKYPLEARQENKTGLVIVELQLDQNGKITDHQFTRASYGFFKEEAERVLKANQNKWKVDGDKLSYSVSLGIVFRLDGKPSPNTQALELDHLVTVTAYQGSENYDKRVPPAPRIEKPELRIKDE
ncbi:M56 family metallopeptidase [Arthrospiribacter ruber]|uniref:M56 family metallopeptidase n=1 Tax=Arthrospiribacter ruber TaxID=2487934 RepID=UPI001C5A7D6A|nr:M56 family metallopeptidase [Arthrospiribacter ruber]